MKVLPRTKLFYVSPWLLAAATALLVLIVVTFTLNNMRREEHLMTAALLQKADTLIRIIHSGSRSAYFSDLRRDISKADPWYEYVQRIIDHVAEDPDVKFLVVTDENKKVIAHNKQEMIGKQIAFEKPPGGPFDKKVPQIDYRFAPVKNEGRVFEAVRHYFPYRPLMQSMFHQSFGRGQGRNPLGPKGMMLRKLKEQKGTAQLDGHAFYVLVGLDMRSYDKSLRRIKLQTFVLSLVMLLVGLGGWLSLSAVQGYRVSQQTLGEMKLFTSLLLAKLPVGIIASDREGHITTFNEAAVRMTALRRKDVIGRKPESVLPVPFAELLTAMEDTQDESISSLPMVDKEVTIKVDNKNQHFFCQVISIEGDVPDHQGWVLLISDLTRIKDLEKDMRENERLAAVGRMAAGVAHEVRNPLSSIKGLALLLKGKFAEESSDNETAGLLVEQVERMNRTVSELLSFARPTPLQLERVSLKDILQDILRLMEADASNNNVSVQLDINPDLQDIAADRDRLNQVFINLLLNGIQAMDEGGDLVVTAENRSDGKSVEIRIKDTGCGISEEIMPQLFYPYFTTKASGTGIGLAISQKIINDHKGTINIDSAEGQGTTVTVMLPIFDTVEGAAHS